MKALFIILFLSAGLISAQDSTFTDSDLAYRNAVKGIQWALHNIPEKKLHLSNDLIDNNIHYASIKISKEVNGYKIESTGYYLYAEAALKIYRSDEWLQQQGYLKPPVTEVVKEDLKKQPTPKGRKKQKNQ